MAMQWLENELRKRGNPGDSFCADLVAVMLHSGGTDVPFPSVIIPVPEKEKPQEFRPFTDQEKEALIKDGAVILRLTGETIEGQETAKRLFWHVTDGGDRLLKLPSITTEVAFYPDPKRFFIPNSGNKDLPTQEQLAKEDGRELRERLGLEDEGLDVVIPDQASTLTELTFRYLDETTQKGKGVWLFGSDYAAAQGLSFVYGRTKNPVNKLGSRVAVVGAVHPDDGVVVDRWAAGLGVDVIHVVRLVVAKKK